MTVLVIGSTGQLARCLQACLSSAIFLSRDEVDLTDSRLLQKKLLAANPAAIVNAAAYTAVDRAETEVDLAWRVNAEAPAAMAVAARVLDIPLVHISTDYVFDGTQTRPYVESDGAAPLNVYGRTKLAGDMAVASLCHKHWILRASWVFSEHGSNFVKTMIKLARERSALRVVADQYGRPTYAGHIAKLIATLVDRRERNLPWGLHHVIGGPATTWHEFASTILEQALTHRLIEKIPTIDAVATADYPTPASRPLRVVLGTLRQGQQAELTPDWREGLSFALKELSSRPRTSQK
jgi:dTDP-4-dehydrorhamnose reductase